MIDSIFKSLTEQPGIQASMVIDAEGQLLTFRGSSLYDRPLLEGVAASLGRAIDSADLLHPEWDEMHVQFGDGSLLVRNLGVLPNQSGRASLAVVADTSLNRSFATVAMRVVVQKLEQVLANGAQLNQLAGMAHATPEAARSSLAAPHPSSLGQLPPVPAVNHLPPHPMAPAPARASDAGPFDPARSGYATIPGSMTYATGAHPGGASPPPIPGHVDAAGAHQSEAASSLAWSGAGTNRSSGIGVAVRDEEALRLLTTLSKSLAPYVGPMAKVFVKDAVRRVCPDVPFSRERLGEVLKVLQSQIEDPSDCHEFMSTIRSVV